MKASMKKRIADKIHKLETAVKTESDAQIIAWVKGLFSAADNDKYFGRLMSQPNGNRFDEWKYVSKAIKTANRPVHIPIKDRFIAPYTPYYRPRVCGHTRDISPAQETVLNAAVGVDVLNGRIERRRQDREKDELLRANREYFISWDKNGRETRIAWDVIRALHPDYTLGVCPIDAGPKKRKYEYHAADIPMPKYVDIQDRPKEATFRPVKVHVNDSAAFDTVQHGIVRMKRFQSPVYAVFGTSALDRAKLLETREHVTTGEWYGDSPAILTAPVQPSKHLQEYTFRRTGDDTVQSYRGTSEPTQAMIEFNPDTMEAELTHQAESDVPFERSFKTFTAVA